MDPAPTLRNLIIDALSKQLGQFSPLLSILAHSSFVENSSFFSDPFFDQIVHIPGTGGPYSTIKNYFSTAQARAIMKAFTEDKSGVLSPMSMQYRDAIEQLTGSKEAADSFIRNPAAGFLLRSIDPLGLRDAGKVMTSTISTASRMYGGYSDVGERDIVSRVMGYRRALYNLYNGQNLGTEGGKKYGGIFQAIRDNPGEFGDLSYKEIMQVAAGMISVEDPFKTVSNMTDSQAVNTKIREFSNRLKDMAKAITPLKEVFGNDIPTILNALEQVTGSSSVLKDPNRVSAIANDIATTLEVSGANKAQYLGALQVMQTGLTTAPGDDRTIFSAAHLTRQYLLSTSSAHAVGLTSSEIQLGAAKLQLGTTRSRFADDYNSALAMYMVEGDPTVGPERTEEGFKRMVQQYMKDGYSGTAALMRVLNDAGVKIQSSSELSRGRGYREYLDYNTRNLGGIMAKEQGVREVFNTAISYTSDSDQKKRLMAIRDKGYAAMVDFLAKRYADEGENQEIHRADYDILAQAGAGIFGTKNTAEFHSFWVAAQRERVLYAQWERQNKLSTTLNKLKLFNNWKGMIDMLKLNGQEATPLKKALAGFFGGMDITNADMINAVSSNIAEWFDKDDSADATAFYKSFRDAMVNSATWSAEKMQRFQSIMFTRDEKGNLVARGRGDKAGAMEAFKNFQRFTTLESTIQKLTEVYSVDGELTAEGKKAIKDFEAEYKEEEARLKKEGKKDSEVSTALKNFRNDVLARAILEKDTKEDAGIKGILEKAIAEEKTGSGSRVRRMLEEAKEKAVRQRDALTKDSEEWKKADAEVERQTKAISAYDKLLAPSFGGMDPLTMIISWIEKIFYKLPDK